MSNNSGLDQYGYGAAERFGRLICHSQKKCGTERVNSYACGSPDMHHTGIIVADVLEAVRTHTHYSDHAHTISAQSKSDVAHLQIAGSRAARMSRREDLRVLDDCREHSCNCWRKGRSIAAIRFAGDVDNDIECT